MAGGQDTDDGVDYAADLPREGRLDLYGDKLGVSNLGCYPASVRPLTFDPRFNFVVGETTPYLQEVITWRVYFMHAFFCACSFILVYFCEWARVSVFIRYRASVHQKTFSLHDRRSSCMTRPFIILISLRLSALFSLV